MNSFQNIISNYFALLFLYMETIPIFTSPEQTNRFTIMKTATQLNKEFSKLNKQYIALDSKLDSAKTENEQESISFEMEQVQIKMSKISADLESL